MPIRTSASGTSSVAASTAATVAFGSSAARSSRTRVTPGRTARKRVPWQWRQIGGRTVSQRVHVRPASSSRTVAPHCSQRTSSLQVRHASSRARPLRFKTHTDRAAASRTRRSSSASTAVSSACPGCSSRVSTTVTRGHGTRVSAVRAPRRAATTTSIVGAGVTTRTLAPARRARSIATSRAFHVGARSSSRASSASSTTTIRVRSGTGAHTAVRPPTTTHAPARARSHAALSSAAERSDRRLSTSRP